jgi:hypothetical protein
MKSAASTTSLLSFLNELRAGKIHYELRQRREDAIMVEIAVPGQRWEVEFLDDQSVEVEVFRTDGQIYDESILRQLVAVHSDALSEDSDEVEAGSPPDKLDFNEAYWDRVAAHVGVPLHHRPGRQRKIYVSQTEEICVLGRVNAGSLPDGPSSMFWFNVEDQHIEILTRHKQAYVAFACGSPENILLVPVAFLQPLLERMNITQRPKIVQYNVHIRQDERGYRLVLTGGQEEDVGRFLIPAG